jgi:hypothetical protein
LRRRSSARADQPRIRSAVRIGLRQVDAEGGVGVGALRRAEARVPHEAEARRHDADDGIRLAVEPDVAAEDVPIGAEPRPQLVRQHDDRRTLRANFARRKAAAEHRFHAEQLEQVR